MHIMHMVQIKWIHIINNRCMLYTWHRLNGYITTIIWTHNRKNRYIIDVYEHVKCVMDTCIEING